MSLSVRELENRLERGRRLRPLYTPNRANPGAREDLAHRLERAKNIKPLYTPRRLHQRPGRGELRGEVRGEVRVGIKRRRGVTGDRDTTAPGFKNIDVTSGSNNKVGGVPAKTLSPLTLGPYIDAKHDRAERFENYWQFGKMWPTAGHIRPGPPGSCEPTPAWLKFRARGYALLKGKRRPLPLAKYGRPTCARYLGQAFTWVASRKQIYVPGYLSLICNLPIIRELRRLLDSGQNIMIIDGDGAPKTQWPQGMPMTRDNWNTMINDTRYSFGHGYVVAALLAGLI